MTACGATHSDNIRFLDQSSLPVTENAQKIKQLSPKTIVIVMIMMVWYNIICSSVHFIMMMKRPSSHRIVFHHSSSKSYHTIPFFYSILFIFSRIRVNLGWVTPPLCGPGGASFPVFVVLVSTSGCLLSIVTRCLCTVFNRFLVFERKVSRVSKWCGEEISVRKYRNSKKLKEF